MTSSLNARQQALVARLVDTLRAEPSVAALALAGSHARGHATAASDIDLALYYHDAHAPDPARLGRIVAALGPDAPPVFSAIGEWGPWVNGGAWLAFDGQRVDVLYRSLEQAQRVLTDCAEGRWELHWAQQPPFGYFSPAFVEELSIGKPLFDRNRELAMLQARTHTYPTALRDRLLQDMLWGAEFALAAFAPKYAHAGDAFGFAACAARVGFQLVQALFALNARWPVPDRIALACVATLPYASEGFAARLNAVLAHPGTTPHALGDALAELRALWQDVRELCGGLYSSRVLPG